MSVQKFDGEVAEIGTFRAFPDFQVYDFIVFAKADGTTLRLENSIGVPAEMAEIFKPGLKGQFVTYNAGFLGRRGVFAVRPQRGPAIAVFKVPGEGMALPMAIFCAITIFFMPFAIVFWLQYSGNKAAKCDGQAIFEGRSLD